MKRLAVSIVVGIVFFPLLASAEVATGFELFAFVGLGFPPRATGDRGGDEWICWYDGAPLRTVPLPSEGPVVRRASGGERFEVETIEDTPFGTKWLCVRRVRGGRPLWIPLAYCRHVAPENLVAGDLPIGRERIGLYDGLPFDYRPSDLVRLPQRYCYNDLPQRLRAEAAEACLRMLDAARREAGLDIKVLSAYRSARTQAYLCRRKIEAAGIDQRLVARPGHSEHQLGTAVDLVRSDGRWLLDERFGQTPEGRWLRFNCGRFGFVLSYTRERTRREGIRFEPWHFRYVRPENVGRFEGELFGGGW